MLVESLAIGTELLLGQIVNTNASDIATRLAASGITHHRQSVIGDNRERMDAAIAAATTRCDALIVTGGIGPTGDDVTRESVASVAGIPLMFDEAHAAEMRAAWLARGRRFPESNLRQAYRPDGAIVIDNHKGSAPGFRIEVNGCWVICLPGVPAEMRAMLDEQVMPFLRSMSGTDGVVVSRVLRTWGMSEAQVGEDLGDLFEDSSNPTVAFLASDGEIGVRLSCLARTGAEAAALIDPIEAEVRRRLGRAVFGIDDDTIEGVIHRLLAQRGLTVGSAESATGGIIAQRLTMTPGASATVRGSVVAYANEVKTRVLGVDPGIIERNGVVSEPVATAMALGARRVLGADVAVAVTGSAGPEPLEQPVGTMIIAVATPDEETVRTLHLPGDRERVRAYAATAALHLVRRAIDPT
ncbi:MAG: competence/damage-inducible protein A [Acidimicrobiia bacterium]